MKPESPCVRTRFFQKDALLYRKHSKRYKQLFLSEPHYQITPGFKENLLAGFEAFNFDGPDWMDEHCQEGIGQPTLRTTAECDVVFKS